MDNRILEILISIFTNKIVLTISILFVALSVKYLTVKWLRKRAQSRSEDKRDLVNNVKNFLNFILIILILSTWADEIQNFAFSIAAFSVAIVLATREFIQCVIGFFYLVSTRPFRIGDWIQVGEFVGEVSATDWIKSTLLEVDVKKYQYTGKTLFIPNNKLITSPIKNLNFLKRYATHHFSIIRDQSVNPYDFLQELQEKAIEYCADFHDVAVRYSQMIERRLDVPIAGPEPHINIVTTEMGDTQVDFEIFCPSELAIEIEQALVKDFMGFWFEHKDKIESRKSDSAQ